MFSLLDFLTYAVITAATPGPNNIMSMSNANRLGFRKALPFNLGIWCGLTVLALACALFCGLLTSLLPVIQSVTLAVGGGYLLFLAYKTWRSDAKIEDRDTKNGFLPGLALQFVNPKLYVYCIVSMQAFLLPYFGGNAAAMIGFALLLAFIGFFFTLLWAAFGFVFRRIFSRYAKGANTVLALLLVYCAVSLFLP